MKICRFFSLFVTLFLLLSCSQLTNNITDDINTTVKRNVPISISSMDYTDPNELYALYVADSVNVIHYKVARLLASVELLAGANFGLGNAIDPYDGYHPYMRRYSFWNLHYGLTTL